MTKDQAVKLLREEAASVKDCFTKFSFQTIAFCAISFGIIVKFQIDTPILSLCFLLITILSLVIAKIGNHKYNTANRNLGFLLYLERNYLINKELKRKNYSLNCEILRKDGEEVAWEEAMRAWRIVQSTVFHKIYKPSRIFPNKNRLNKENNKTSDKEKQYWFEPKTIVNKNDAYYYAGSYLESMQFVLYLIAFIALIPIILAGKQTAINEQFSQTIILWSGAFIGFIYFCWRVIRIFSRRKLLEDGLLSIHSCGILWEAVVLSYNLAIRESISKIKSDSDHPLTYYTKSLSEVANDLAENIEDIYRWVQDKRKQLATPTNG